MKEKFEQNQNQTTIQGFTEPKSEEHNAQIKREEHYDYTQSQYRDYSKTDLDNDHNAREYCDNNGNLYIDTSYNQSPANSLHQYCPSKLQTENRKIVDDKTYLDTGSAFTNYGYDESESAYRNLTQIPFYEPPITYNGSSVIAQQGRLEPLERPLSYSKKYEYTRTSPSTVEEKVNTKVEIKSEIKKQSDDDKDSVKKINVIQDSDLDPEKRPAYSYVALITFALKSSPNNKLQLSSIYKWISDTFPFFKNKENKRDAGWKNSIRHNLSLNECFEKIPREGSSGGGKGHFWMLHPAYQDMFENGNFKRRKKSRRANASYITPTSYGHSKFCKAESQWMYNQIMSGGPQYNTYSAQMPQHFPAHHYSPYPSHYSHMNQVQSSVLGGSYSSLGASLGGHSAFAPPYYNANNAIPAAGLTSISSLSPAVSLTSENPVVSPISNGINSVYSAHLYSALTPVSEHHYNPPTATIGSVISPIINSGLTSHPGSPIVHSPYETTEASYNTCLPSIDAVNRVSMTSSLTQSRPSPAVPVYEQYAPMSPLV